MLSHRLKWVKSVFGELARSRQCFNVLIPWSPTVGRVSLNCASFDHAWGNPYSPSYHCRHSGRNRQYECDCGI